MTHSGPERPLLLLHGVPTGPKLWSRLSIPHVAPTLTGNLLTQVDQVAQSLTSETVVVGHDMGGVVAAMAALVRPPRCVILTGTALGPYWTAVRCTALPVAWRYFYARHAGKKFVAGSVAPHRAAEALAWFSGQDPLQMRAVARSMRPPAGLAHALSATVPVRLIWGERDRWYPQPVARAVARATCAPLQFVPGGHFAMWEHPEAFSAALHGLLDALD